jgi:hypothetical protein
LVKDRTTEKAVIVQIKRRKTNSGTPTIVASSILSRRLNRL